VSMVEDELTRQPAVVWQNYAPDLTARAYQDLQWVFIDRGNGAPQPFNPKNPITSGLNQVLLLYPGGLVKSEDSKLAFDQLLQTGEGVSGTVAVGDPRMFMGRALARFDPGRPNTNREELPWVRSKEGYILVAQITGAPPQDDAALAAAAAIDDDSDPADAAAAAEAAAAGQPEKKMNVVLVADIDFIIPSFFSIREGGDENFLPATQNVTFILNIIDALTGDDRFVEIRKRTRLHRTLARIEEATREYREKAASEREEFIAEIQKRQREATEAMQKKIEEVESRTDLRDLEMEVLLEQTRRKEQAKLEAEIASLADERRSKLKEIEFEQGQEVRSVQDRYKLYALLIPPIPPLLLALAVFFRRRELERQGVSRERLR
ncbi:MAG TPA: hypothetical protein PJ982_19420, partial [Lacipirellulaceae bacterium]|nr:hypothetical protein [Lacipirellulaceae bacterium]